MDVRFSVCGLRLCIYYYLMSYYVIRLREVAFIKMSNTCLKAVMLLAAFSARFSSVFSNQSRERDQYYVMLGAFNLTSLLFILTRF